MDSHNRRLELEKEKCTTGQSAEPEGQYHKTQLLSETQHPHGGFDEAINPVCYDTT